MYVLSDEEQAIQDDEKDILVPLEYDELPELIAEKEIMNIDCEKEEEIEKTVKKKKRKLYEKIKLRNKAEAKVDCSSPGLCAGIYLDNAKLERYSARLRNIFITNIKLIQYIYRSYREGPNIGYTNPSYEKFAPTLVRNLALNRQNQLDVIHSQNLFIYKLLKNAKPRLPTAVELLKKWKQRIPKLNSSTRVPMKIYGDMDYTVDPTMEATNVKRPKVSMEFWTDVGPRFGRLVLEVFTDICPAAAQLFLNLVTGDEKGYCYEGKNVFRIVSGLYASAGDVTRNNGFGSYDVADAKALYSEKHKLKHTVAGLVTMQITKSVNICASFSVTLKPLPQWDYDYVIVGRVIWCQRYTLDRVACCGTDLGVPDRPVTIRNCKILCESVLSAA